MRQLIKFFANKEYAEMFKSGKLYMNSLAYFWDNGFEEQRDVLEGISDTLKKDGIGLPIDMQQVVNGDVMFRLEAYRYCNLYCFYRVDISDQKYLLPTSKSIFPDTRFINLPPRSMSEFGDYVAVLKDEEEFISRVLKAVKTDWLCIAGDVRYKERAGVKKPPKHSMYLASKELYEATHWLRGGANRTSTKDCFCKTTVYAEQKEWRICLFRNCQDDKAYVLDIGDLSDIVDIVPSSRISEFLIKKYSPCIYDKLAPAYMGFKGNVTRQEFKDKLYSYNNGMGKLMMVIG